MSADQSDLKHDKQRLDRMLETIKRYRFGAIELDKLISDLEALLESLEEKPDAWRASFLTYCGALEEVQTLIEDEKRTSLTDLDRKLMDRSLDKLKLLIGKLSATPGSYRIQ